MHIFGATAFYSKKKRKEKKEKKKKKKKDTHKEDYWFPSKSN